MDETAPSFFQLFLRNWVSAAARSRCQRCAGGFGLGGRPSAQVGEPPGPAGGVAEELYVRGRGHRSRGPTRARVPTA